MATKLTIYNLNTHNLYAIFAKFLDICKDFTNYLVNGKGNLPRRDAVPRFSDLEIIPLSLTAESLGINFENYLFSKLEENRSHISNLISRRQFNDCRKLTGVLCNQIRENIATFRPVRFTIV